ncbi:MAG: (Fe-S)-binding protein [Acidimicrobiia bacterium]
MTTTLRLDEDELVACVACGLCLPHCPTYRVTGRETASPRGRIAAMQAVQMQGAPMDAVFETYMEECVQCLGCEAACPSSVPFGHLMEGARDALARTPGGRSWRRRVVEWTGYRLVLPRHGVLVAVSWLLLLAQRLHLVPRRYSLPRLEPRDLARRLRADAGPTDVYLYPGCVMDAWQRGVHRSAAKVMHAAGVRVGLPGPGADCCGALHAHAGRLDEARVLARRVIAAMPGTDPVGVDSAGCGAAMKDFGHLLGTDDGARFAARVRDFSEWLAECAPLALRPTGKAVVVQDPCHLRHVQRAHDAVREVLAPAYALLSTEDDGLCCGAGGAYNLMQPALATEIRSRKLAAIQSAGGPDPLVVSANPGCAMHLAGAGLRVRHPAELLADALDG